MDSKRLLQLLAAGAVAMPDDAEAGNPYTQRVGREMIAPLISAWRRLSENRNYNPSSRVNANRSAITLNLSSDAPAGQDYLGDAYQRWLFTPAEATRRGNLLSPAVDAYIASIDTEGAFKPRPLSSGGLQKGFVQDAAKILDQKMTHPKDQVWVVDASEKRIPNTDIREKWTGPVFEEAFGKARSGRIHTKDDVYHWVKDPRWRAIFGLGALATGAGASEADAAVQPQDFYARDTSGLQQKLQKRQAGIASGEGLEEATNPLEYLFLPTVGTGSAMQKLASAIPWRSMGQKVGIAGLDQAIINPILESLTSGLNPEEQQWRHAF